MCLHADMRRCEERGELLLPLLFFLLVVLSVLLYFAVSLMDPGFVLTDAVKVRSSNNSHITHSQVLNKITCISDCLLHYSCYILTAALNFYMCFKQTVKKKIQFKVTVDDVCVCTRVTHISLCCAGCSGFNWGNGVDDSSAFNPSAATLWILPAAGNRLLPAANVHQHCSPLSLTRVTLERTVYVLRNSNADFSILTSGVNTVLTHHCHKRFSIEHIIISNTFSHKKSLEGI